MKTLFILFMAIIFAQSAYSQNIEGEWNGILKVQGTQLRLVFHVTKTGTGYTSTMDSPDQNAFGIPVTSTFFDNSTLKIEVANIKMEYSGVYKSADSIEGTFKQMGQSFPMNLSREKAEKEIIIRKQEPTKPYPYYTEDVKFVNKKDSITLAGTLTLPSKEGVFPVVVLITGSGPQNRDEELMGHKPFLVIADYITKKGIGVLRYDERGVGESQGKFGLANSVDFASDVESAVQYLKSRREINKKQIGLIGHSEGGIIAPMVAAKSKDVGFIILLAGTGIPGHELLLVQQELIARAEGVSEEEITKTNDMNKKVFDLIVNSKDEKLLIANLNDSLTKLMKDLPDSMKTTGETDSKMVEQMVAQLTSPWMLFFIKYNPYLILKDVKCPVLALNGDKDLQVPSKINLEAIKKGLEKGGNKKVTIKELKGLNHLFQECNSGSPSEYANIEQTFSPLALIEIDTWILKLTKNMK